MDEEATGSNPGTPPTNNLTTKEGVAKEIEKWMIDADGNQKSYKNAITYIQVQLKRPLSCLEMTWFQRQYVITLLGLWLKRSLENAFKYLENDDNDISIHMSTVLNELDSINSFENIRSQVDNVLESQLQNFCDKNCRFLHLILEQEDIFTNTPRFTLFVNYCLKQFKTVCIDGVFSRCVDDVVNDQEHGANHKTFINALNTFLSNVNEEKNLQAELKKEESLTKYVIINDNESGQNLVNKLVDGSNYEWLKTFPSIANSLMAAEWTPKLEMLTKETCKKFLFPETEIELKEEEGKQIISIKGVTIFISQIIEEMNRFKAGHHLEEIKIVGLKSVRIDHDLDNTTWHGINVGIVTDKLIVDGKVCWDVSGNNSIAQQSTDTECRKVDFREPGESGGNVRVVCNQIINGHDWRIVSDGGDGSAGCKWTQKEYETFFPSMLTGDRKKNMKTVLETLDKLLPANNRRKGKDINPNHEGNFFIEGSANDGSEITAIFYGEKNKEETLILTKRSHIGQGGYGGDITIECFSNSLGETNGREDSTSVIPLTGKIERSMPLKTVRTGVYEASCPNGNVSKVTGDVAFVHQVANGESGTFYGFGEKDEKILIRFNVENKPKKEDKNVYVQYYEDEINKKKYYAKLTPSSNDYLKKDVQLLQVDAIKKRSIIRQSLVQHMVQIDEWKQLTESIQGMVSNPTQYRSNRIGEILEGFENNVKQFHQLNVQRQQHHLEKIEREHNVKPAFDSSGSFQRPKLIGRHPVWKDYKDDGQSKEVDKTKCVVFCFDVLPTEGGIDSALHCLFGQLNADGTKYVCKDTNKFRKRIGRYIRRKHDGERTYNAVGSFVLRVKDDKLFPVATDTRDKYIESITNDYPQLKGMETQILAWLKHNDKYDGEFLDPENVDEWNDAWKESIKAELFKEQEIWRNDEDLKQECAKYIESRTGALELAELEILAHQMKFNVYTNRHDSSPLQYVETLSWRLNQKNTEISGKPSRKFCILYEGNGQWSKLSPNNNLHLFCSEFTWRNRMLLDMDAAEQIKQLESVIGKWVEYYNNRNISRLFYFHIVETYQPIEWECEFLLLEMEERLVKPWENENDRDNWRKKLRHYFSNHKQALSLFVKIAMEKKEGNDILFSLNLDKMLEMLTFLENEMKEDLTLNENDFSQLPLLSLFYRHRRKFWEKEIDNWMITAGKTNESMKADKSEYVKLLLEKEYESPMKLLQNLTTDIVNEIEKELENLLTPPLGSRNLKELIAEINESDAEQKEMMEKTKEIIEMANKPESQSKTVDQLIRDGVALNDDSSLANFLYVFDDAVKKTMNFHLRDTQKMAILTLLNKGLMLGKTLAQVSTGEGKSIIVAGVAIGFVLKKETEEKRRNPLRNFVEVISRKIKARKNNKVDVITSNDVLALRDSNLPGLKQLYKFFNVNVANNCSQLVDERKRAYSMDVVYGQLANFQRDHLLDKFYKRSIRDKRSMDYVIIDEVDCMLLDRGNNMLYLSHDIPGMEMLESLYVFIWRKIQDNPSDIKRKEKIKSAIQYDLYGQITKEDFKNVYAPLGEEELEQERTMLWEYLIKQQIIDRRGRMLKNVANQVTGKIIDFKPTHEALKEKHLNSKITFYLQSIVKRQRRIRIPSHLLDLVDRQLDTWLDNAERALDLKQDEDYVVDHDHSDTSPDFNPQVIIIDPDTGTDQSNSQWDGALHQFLQLKEGCKLTLQSLKAVFVSNATYINKYRCLAGVSGTLGSKPEQQFLKSKYKCDLFTIPTAFHPRFRINQPKLYRTKESWRNAVRDETRQTTTDPNRIRSIVIFCQSIKEVNEMYQHLKSDSELDSVRIHRYTRDYEIFEFENAELNFGHVIVTTNLAGRGTDIKISKALNDNGGLHICLTYFPENERVEEQAMGRAARKGEQGSGILILCEEETGTNEEWEVEKSFVMREERAWQERQRIAQLSQDFKNIEMLEDLIEHYTDNLSVYKVKEKLGKEDDNSLLNIVHNTTLDKWALWLDERDYSFKYFHIKYRQREFKITLYDFKQNKCVLECVLNWMTPARRITIINKHLSKTITWNQKINPADTLDQLIDSSSDHFFYPAAFYYRAFIHLTNMTLGKENKREEEKKKERDEFILALRKTETILNEHIDMQFKFSLIHLSDAKTKSQQISSFCAVDGYMEQKKNHMTILKCFLHSIQWLLGRHCSLSDLRLAASETPSKKGIFRQVWNKVENVAKDKLENEELKQRKIRLQKVDEHFKHLIELKCIVCKLNDPNTIPSDSVWIKNVIDETETSESSTNNSEGFAATQSITGDKINNDADDDSKKTEDLRSQIIQQIADFYGAGLNLESILKSVFNKSRKKDEINKEGIEEEIEKDLKKKIEKDLIKENLIPSTRKAFWKALVEARALKPLSNWKTTECFIVLEEQLNECNLDSSKAITLEFGTQFRGSKDNKDNGLYVLYNPTYNDHKPEKKLMFSKEYIKRVLLNSYNEKKKKFESNKIATLDLITLKTVNLESFGRLYQDELTRINITDKSEQDRIWEQLKDQEIITNHGDLVSSFEFENKFNYPECPVYEVAVNCLVRKKFVTEVVRQQWLKSESNPELLKAIHLLRRKPYRDMLVDLKAAHVISGARVTEDPNIDLKKEVKKITTFNEESGCLVKYLTMCQPIYAKKIKKPEFFIADIEHYLKNNYCSSELDVFRHVGFDSVIDIKDKEFNFQELCLLSLFTPLIFVGGLAWMGAGAAPFFLVHFFGFKKLPSTISKNLIVGGFSTILYIIESIMSGKGFKLTDFGRQCIRSALGKTKPIDAIREIDKLHGSSNRSFVEETITNEHPWTSTAYRNEMLTVGNQFFSEF